MQLAPLYQGTGCLSCDEDRETVQATVSLIVMAIATIVILSIFWQR
jgi:hypothetical protein